MNLYQLSNIVVEIIYCYIFQVIAAPLHEVIYFLSATRLEQNIQNWNQQSEWEYIENSR